MDTQRICLKCRQTLPDSAAEGLCPSCLARAALDTEQATTGATINLSPLIEETPDARKPPTVAELAGQFPQLEILELLGVGGMGMVYKARQPRLDRLVALKILSVGTNAHASFAERFSREAKALAKLNHPGIVAVYDFGQTGQYYYFVMEYVDGMNLRQLLRSQALEPRQALDLVCQICVALQFAHDENVIHRDIKPENILLNKKGRVKIADFGLAKLLGNEPDTALTMSQAMMGTLNYMAPEQRENAQKVDHRADVYSLGVVFYEMLTGELPMGRFDPPSAASRGAPVDTRLDEVVLRTLEKKPERRYQQVSDVKTAVDSIVGQAVPPPVAAPIIAPVEDDILSRDYQVRIRHYLRLGWAMVRTDFWPTVGTTTLVISLLQIAVFTLNQLASAAKGTQIGFSILQAVLTGPTVAGLSLYFIKKIRRERATVETAFSGFSKRFLHLFLANVVITALMAAGFVVGLLPGFYLAVAWSFALPLVIDKGMDFWPAMELSRKIVNKHWWKMLGFILVLGSTWLVGLLCVGVGLFAAIAVTHSAFFYLYEDIFGNWTPADPSVIPKQRLKTGTGNSVPPARWKSLIFILALLVGGLLAAVGIGIAAFEKQWNRRHPENGGITQKIGSDVGQSPLVQRTKIELGKRGFRYSGIDIVTSNATTLVVTFEGLEQRDQAGTNSTPSAQGKNATTNGGDLISFSEDKGIQIRDPGNPEHVNLSIFGFHIGVNEDLSDHWTRIEGSMSGVRQPNDRWLFQGYGQLEPVRFEAEDSEVEDQSGVLKKK